MSKKEPEGPGPEENNRFLNGITITKLISFFRDFRNNSKVFGILRCRLRRDVSRDTKNILDIKRPIIKCGPLSIF